MKPTYAELATQFWEYLACTNNDGDPVAPEGSAIERALSILQATGVEDPYFRPPPDELEEVVVTYTFVLGVADPDDPDSVMDVVRSYLADTKEALEHPHITRLIPRGNA